MRKLIKPSAKYLLTAMLAAPLAHTAFAQVELLDQVAAVVDSDVVMLTELEERVNHIYRRLEETDTTAPPRSQLVPQVLDRLIVERVQLNMAQRAGVRVSDAELNQHIARMAQAQNMTVDQLVEKAHNDGTKLSNLRRQIRNDILIKRVQEAQVRRRIRVTEQEITNFLNSEENWQLSAVLINLNSQVQLILKTRFTVIKLMGALHDKKTNAEEIAGLPFMLCVYPLHYDYYGCDRE